MLMIIAITVVQLILALLSSFLLWPSHRAAHPLLHCPTSSAL